MYVRQWRQYRRMKMEVLAEKCGLSVAHISQIETGSRGYTRASLEAIANALDTSPGYLLEFNPRRRTVFIVKIR